MTRTAVKPPTRSAYTPAMTRKPRKRKLRLDRLGRVTIPRKLLEKTKIGPGDAIEIEAVPGGILIHRPAPPGLVWDRGMLLIDAVPLEDPLEFMKRCDREDAEKLVRRALGR
jgi:bifunctional DNA-binding transcriptional regulator/antitoxin component of YhaV-PrlF toxin-antitoxin module